MASIPADQIATNSESNEGPTSPSAPLPLSFPAILRNPGLNDRFAHLRHAHSVDPNAQRASSAYSKKARKRHDNEGKRWIRRSENGLCYVLLSTARRT